ncbi:MAG: RuBisCO large subunit C-terminal-like domain-containing protein [Proteobacteria bacterium]|nr:RuBisCO large subunit C-terminal-like domain-containing protein [Pseudomonadota bacterium]
MSIIQDNIIVTSESIDPAVYVVASYLAQGPAEEDMLSRAVSLAIEQTIGRGIFNIEGMHHLVEERGGRLIGFMPIPDHESRSSQRNLDWKQYVFRIAFPVENTGFQIPMLLTTILSDASMSGMIKLIDLDIPIRFLEAFQGPKFGLAGIRGLLGGVRRGLICSVLKPCVGVDAKTAGDIFYQHALGGSDVIKDDELMAYSGEIKLEDRVKLCIAAENRAYEETGEHTLYLPNITDRPDKMLENAKRAIDAGANGLMITPLTAGFGAVQMLAEDPNFQVPIFGHPAILGTTSWSPDYGISEHILVGKLLRIAGADINAIPAPYGRLTHLREKFLRLFKISRSPMAHIKPMITQTGGSINPINACNVLRDVGNDVMLVAGGSVQDHPMGLAAGIKAFRQAIDAYEEGIALKEAAQVHPELGKAWDLWGEDK